MEGAVITDTEVATARNATLPKGLALNARIDAYWVQPLVTFLVLSGFVAYATWRVLENQFFIADNGAYHYATPFGNPNLAEFAVVGPPIQFLAEAIPVVGGFLLYPGVLILPFVAGFRFTCYYYRKAYYRSFAMSPPACAVPGTRGKGWKGERGLMVFQNLHRYFFYAALVVLLFNFIDMVKSISTPNGLYFGVGSALMILNVAFLSFYTLGCHSLRHLVGGKLDCFSCSTPARIRYGLWSRVTMLNKRHQLWAWVSLVWVAGTDFYIRWVASADILGFNLFGLGVPA